MNVIVMGCNSDIGKQIMNLIMKSNINKALFVSRSKISFSQEHSEFYFMDGIDLTNQEHLNQISIKVKEIFTNEFTVIHSVGDFWYHKPLEECTMQMADSMMRSQYLTLYGVIHTLIPIMKNVGGGRFVAFSCNSVLYNYPELAPFTASKAAIETLIKCVANEYSGEKIYANAIALPTIRTEKVVDSKPQGDQKNYISDLELADIILNEIAILSKYVTGNVIKIFKHSDTFYNQGYFERNPSGKTNI